MLFRPTADQRVEGILAMLDVWNEEADRFRAAASTASRGDTPSSLLAAGAEEAHDGLMLLLEDIDRALESLPPGDRGFAALLSAQAKAVALLESVSNSMDVLSLVVSNDRPAAVVISRQPQRQAAE